MNSYEKVKFNELQVGDVLIGSGVEFWRREYEVIQILEEHSNKLRVVIKYGTETMPYSAYNTRTFNIKSRYMPYDPTQQGDTEDDI